MISPDQSQQTVTDKNHPDKNVLQFEDGQERGARGARFCPMMRRRTGTRPSQPPKSSKVCGHKKVRRPAKPDTSHIIVEKVSRILIAIMFIAFNGIYWPALFSEDDQAARELIRLNSVRH